LSRKIVFLQNVALKATFFVSKYVILDLSHKKKEVFSVTELIFILDRSGSMGGLESDTVGGFNAMLTKQKAESGECRLTTVLFDNDYEILHDRIDIQAVSPITEAEYFVRGQTALLDAIGRTIGKIMGVQKQTAAEYRADKVLFCITTDGMENSSREFTAEKVKAMIEEKKSQGWEFVFLGANIDAVETAAAFGIGDDRAFDYLADGIGTGVGFAAMSAAATSMRSKGVIYERAFAEIKSDMEKRGPNKKAK
jgi:uncharacterized protein YegL